MSGKIYNFDEIVERRGTGSLKYDFAESRGKPKGVLPMWVADMDFKTADEILLAVKERTDHGVFGYTEPTEGYYNAVIDWQKNRHDWEIEQSWITPTPGVVFALATAVRAFTKPGGAVLIQQPVYYPFKEVIQNNGRRVISSDLVYSGGGYGIDFDDFEQKIINNGVKLFILCSPHNPVGRVWSAGELQKLGEICLRRGVVVVSDEIHADFTFGGSVHTPFASLGAPFADIAVTCTSPTKTFNLAGLQVSNIIISNAALRRAFRKAVAATGYSQMNTLSLTACEAAYSLGGGWYGQALAYIEGNIRYLKDFLAENLPQITVCEVEGTYLAWLNFRALGLGAAELSDFLLKKANLWLDDGCIFGKSGEGFERINLACPRPVLQQALNNLKRAVLSYI